MTLRRWENKNKTEEIPSSLEPGIREGIYRLITQGHLSADSKSVTMLLEDTYSLSFEACMKGMGADQALNTTTANNEETTAMVLAQIGHGSQHRKHVDENIAEFSKYKEFGKSWGANITTLLKVIKSEKIELLEKVVAYGALFYLIYPFDLIPDAVPGVGYVDDFTFVSFAVAFCMKRFSDILK